MIRASRRLPGLPGPGGSPARGAPFSPGSGLALGIRAIFAAQRPNEPGLRFWNHQLVRYAAYRQPDGSIIGDPHSLPFTEKIAEVFGWKGAGTHFDLLPLVVQLPGRPPQLFELPPEAAHEVQITHPDFEWFADLGLKWYAVPALSDMMLEIGGVRYPSAPFSGWYMCTEIGSRNFGDVDRYNLLPTVADKMGLNRRSDRTLWKDRALLELNAAVLYSFQQ